MAFGIQRAILQELEQNSNFSVKNEVLTMGVNPLILRIWGSSPPCQYLALYATVQIFLNYGWYKQ